MAHHCHALLCGAACPPRWLMCRGCWAMVSPETQAEVYRTVKLRDRRSVDATWAPWWRASHQAIYEVATKTPERFAPGWSPDPWLAKHIRDADEMERDA